MHFRSFLGLRPLAIIAICCGLAFVSGLAGAGNARAQAALTVESITANRDNYKARMEALTSEIKQLQILGKYCSPPGKTEDAAALDALEAKVIELQNQYAEFRGSTTEALTKSASRFTRVTDGAERYDDMARASGRFWRQANAASGDLARALQDKRTELDRATTDPCHSTPRTGSIDPPRQPVAVDPLAGAKRPDTFEATYPALPANFCSDTERLRFVIDNINSPYLRSWEIAVQAAEYRTRVEEALNSLVQAGQNRRGNPAFENVLRERTWAIEFNRRADAYARAMDRLRDTALHLPIIDCSQRTPTRVGDAGPRSGGSTGTAVAGRRFDTELEALVAIANVAARNCDKASYDAALAQLRRLGIDPVRRLALIDRILRRYEAETRYSADNDLDRMRRQVAATESFNAGGDGQAQPGSGATQTDVIQNEALYRTLRRMLELVAEMQDLKSYLAALDDARNRIGPLLSDCTNPAPVVGTVGDLRKEPVDLRGVGSNRTLVLNDGTRVQTGDTGAKPADGAQQEQPDPRKLQSNTLILQDGTRIIISGDIGARKVDRPSTRYFRLDSGGAFKAFPLLRFDADPDVDLSYQLQIGYRFSLPEFVQEGFFSLSLRGWYFDGTGRGGSGSVSPGPGESFGLFSPPTQQMPFGGYSTGQPLSGIDYRTRFQNFGGEMQFRYMRSVGDVILEPWVGFSVGQTNVKDHLGLDIGMPVFTGFEQSTKIGSTYVGPSIGFGVTYQMESGFYLQGMLRGGLQFHNGDGRWSTFVPLADAEPRTQNLSQNKTAYAVGAGIGIGYRWGGFDARLAVDIGYGNGSPYLKYGAADDTASGTGGAKIGYGGQTDYGINLSVRYRF